MMCARAEASRLNAPSMAPRCDRFASMMNIVASTTEAEPRRSAVQAPVGCRYDLIVGLAEIVQQRLDRPARNQFRRIWGLWTGRDEEQAWRVGFHDDALG